MMHPLQDEFANWAKRLLLKGIYSPGGGPQGINKSWMDYRIQVVKAYQGQMIAALSKDTLIDLHDRWIPKAEPYLTDETWKKEWDRLHHEIKQINDAYSFLQTLIEYEAKEEWRSGAEPTPLEGDPASGENDEAKRGETLEPVGNVKDMEFQFAEVRAQAPPAAEFEVREQSQPEPALPPAAPLSRFQDSGADERSTREIVDPAFIHTQEQFLEACHVAAQHLIEAQNVWQAKRVVEIGEMLEALARTKALGKEFELFGKAIRLRAYFKAAQFEQTVQQNGQKTFDQTDKRLMRDLKKFTEDGFEQVLNEGLEKGNLAERLFRVSASKSTRGTPPNKADQYDPMRFFISFLADMRANPDSFKPSEMAKFVQHPLVQENFAAIEQIYIDFSVAFVGAWRAWKAQSEAKV